MRIFPLACILLLGVGLSLVAFFLIRHTERERIEQEFDWHTRSHCEALRTNLERSEECLYTLRDLFQSTAYVTPAKFRRAAEDLRQRHRGVQQLEWVPRSRRRTARRSSSKRAKRGRRITKSREGSRSTTPCACSGTRGLCPGALCRSPGRAMRRLWGTTPITARISSHLIAPAIPARIAATRRVPLREPTGKEFGWAAFCPSTSRGPEPTDGRGAAGTAARLCRGHIST